MSARSTKRAIDRDFDIAMARVLSDEAREQILNARKMVNGMDSAGGRLVVLERALHAADRAFTEIANRLKS